MLYPHTITAWLKDDSERSAKWERLLITGCRFTKTRGATPSTAGDVSAQESLILIDAVNCSLKRGDRVALGVFVEEEPPADTLTVNTVHPVYLGKDPHHFEVSAS